jgi:hypothetical protein
MGRYAESMECFNNSLKLDPRDKFSSWFFPLIFLVIMSYVFHD